MDVAHLFVLLKSRSLKTLSMDPSTCNVFSPKNYVFLNSSIRSKFSQNVEQPLAMYSFTEERLLFKQSNSRHRKIIQL